RFEGERLDSPGPERPVIVSGSFRVDLHAVAKLAQMLVERWLKPALAQVATLEPARGNRRHLLDDALRTDIVSAEHLERSRRAAPLRKGCAFEHYGAWIGARHPQVGWVGAGIDPRARTKRPAEAGRGIGLPAFHLDELKVDIKLEGADEPQAKLPER